LLAGIAAGAAQAQTPGDSRFQKLEQENATLKKRLDALEAVVQKEGLPATDKPSYVKALSQMTLGGFVTASYFYDFSEPNNNISNGYLWNQQHNNFTLNKFKLTLASPAAERSGDKWDAGYRVSLMMGDDAPIVNTGGNTQGLQDLREAFIDLNVPIGTGLNVKAGQLISLLNFESGDGGAVNPNFSQGNQWFFTGNGPSAGVQLGYALSEMFDVKVRVQNGMFTGFQDNNGFKTFMGSVGVKPNAKTSLSFIGFGGREGTATDAWLKGGSFIGSIQLAEKNNVNFATELDYFNADIAGTDDTTDWWSVGTWLWADFTPTFGAAVRADYLADNDGSGTSGLLDFPVNPGQDIFSLTFTLNIKPTPNVKIQPEIRYEHTSLDGAFDGEDDRFIAGAGISYLF
jgi:hypothetical protein